MFATARLLDACLAATGLHKAALARALGIPKQHLTDFGNGTRPIPDHVAVAMATLANLDPAYVLARLHGDRATGAARQAWFTLANLAEANATDAKEKSEPA